MHRRDVITLLGMSADASLLQPLSATERETVGRSIHDALIRDPAKPPSHAPALSATVARVADLVMPRSDTPGALDVRVPEFVDLLMTKWYSAAERGDFEKGMADFERRAGTGGFVAQAEAAQISFLKTLDGKKGPKGSAEVSFGTLKWLTTYGYFTSERVQRDVLKTVIMPGRFDGCVPVRH